jgi:hypothetical protein
VGFDCLALALARVGGREKAILVRATDGIRLGRQGGYAAMPWWQARREIERVDLREIGRVREFIARLRLTSFPVSSLDDQELLALLRDAVAGRDLVGLREVEGAAVGKEGTTKEGRRLVREIEAKTRNRLGYLGRQYKLVADVDLSRVPERDRFEVVGHADAVKVLDGLARQTGVPANLGALFEKARDKLTPDWRPPRFPDGLILLRRSIAPPAPLPPEGPPITPSQMKAMVKKTEWIEVEVLDEDGNLYTGPYQIELPDGSLAQGDFDGKSVWGKHNIDAGICKITLPAKKEPPAKPSGAEAKKVVSIKWAVAEAWCSEVATVEGQTENYASGESVEVKAKEQGGSQTQTLMGKVSGKTLRASWTIKEILPAKQGGHLAPDLKMDALAGGQTSPTPLTVKFVTAFAKIAHVQDRMHFELSLADNVVLIESDIKFVKGWGGEVVKLGARAPAGTGGLLDGQLAWAGYRWMKNVGLGKRFWDGAAWQSLPAGFVLADSNNFAVGFYKDGASFTCQYGGTWPENFTDWNIDAADKQSTITGWKNNIETTWTGKFDLKRQECKSSDKTCCRYSTKAAVSFSKQATFSAGMLIIADGNIRSNDSLLFLGETRIAVAAHEFGHHLGNPDEYSGAAVDTSLNSDGASAGIDPDSIMGQNLTKVKARHLREICKAFADGVTGAFGKTYHYLAVPP